ncbi:TPA: InlB B-repeat-containing protein [Streptococcus suis]|nr:InlB B-repeat-containing protein [Streptococcus suis]
MSKQKVVSSLLLSTVVLGGLAFYSTTTVKAESLETDVTSVSSGDVVEKPVVSDGGESDFLAEEELEDDETLEEELNEKAEEVTEPSSSEALLQPRAMMSDSGSNDTEEIPVDDSVSVSEKIAESKLIQTSNVDSKAGNNQAKIKASVSVEPLKVEQNKLEWQVTFDTSAWSFDRERGGFYFVLPEGLELTGIIDNNHGKSNIIREFPTDVNARENDGGRKYRFFNKEQNSTSFNEQWGWSVGQAAPDATVNSWKSGNRFSNIYFIDQIADTTPVTYTLTAKVTAPGQKSFPLMAVMKSFGYKNHSWTEFTSLGAREIILEKEKPLPPKEDPKPEEPKQEAPQTPAPDAPQPEGSKDTPEASPKPEAPQTPPAPEASQPEAPESSGIVELGTIPKESLKVKVTFKEKGDILTTPDSTYRLQEGQYLEEVIIGSNIEDTLARAQKRVTTKEGYEFVGWALESDPEKEIEKNLKVSHDITLVAIVRKKSSEETLKPMEPKVEKPTPEVPQVPEAPQTPEAPTEEPKKEDAPAPSTPSVPEEQPKETPAPEVPSTPEKQPEAPKEEPEQDAPQTPEAPSTPKEEAPKEEPKETPKPEMPEAPQVPEEQPKDTPAPEVPLVPEEKPMDPEVDKPKPEAPQAPSTPEEKPQVPEAPKPAPEAPKEEPKQEEPQTPQVPSTPKEEAPKEEVPTPPAPSVPEEQPKETPTPEVPKQEDVQPEAPKSDKAETDKPMPETKQPDVKQPKADDMPKEQQPKAEAPKAEQPQMEAPKKDSEAPKSDKVETDKPMPETKQPDMKQPKADKPEAEKTQMPRTEGMKPESKASMMPKAEASKTTLPNTGEASSAIGWLGGALATLVTGLYLFKNKKEE